VDYFELMAQVKVLTGISKKFDKDENYSGANIKLFLLEYANELRDVADKKLKEE